MGGGDLNTKKSWHPNTMKNQERVWKAEQAAAEEKKRIVELQRERAMERDRTELNEMAKRNAGTADDNRLHWMYDKPDKKAHHEDYLLGKSIEKNYDQPEKSDDVIPAVARRIVGSSMLSAGDNTQVDLQRKMKEDPLLLVKERERAARAALLNNPLHRRKIAQLLRKEQEQKKEKSSKKAKKKDLDDVLAAKLSALGGDKNVDLAALLASGDSSSDSSDDNSSKKKKKKKKQKKSKKSKKTKEIKKLDTQDRNDNSDEHRKKKKHKDKSHSKSKGKKTNDSHSQSESRKRDRQKTPDWDIEPYDEAIKHETETKKQSSDSDSDKEIKSKRPKRESPERSRSKGDNNRDRRRESREGSHRKGRRKSPERDRRSNYSDDKRRSPPQKYDSNRRQGLNEEEKAVRLAEMLSAGVEREESRGRRVAAMRAADSAAHAPPRPGGVARAHHALPDSIESRIHTKRHYIQRGDRHMNEHFARR